MPARKSQSVVVDGREIALTNLDKVLWPEAGITKAQYVHYLSEVASYMLPYLQNRPLTVTRYPDGISGKSFYQKDCPDYAPEWIQTYGVESKDNEKVIHYILAQDRATLVWLANQAALEMHPWLSTTRQPDYPTYAVFDLDPSEGVSFEDVVKIAYLVKDALDHLGLTALPKLSGATGLHIFCPVAPKYSYEITSGFVGHIGKLIADLIPETATTERLVKNRGRRVYIDHLQNLPGKTIVAPYSVRPRPGAPVSVPIPWDMLTHVTPDQFTIDNALDWLAQHGDLYVPLIGMEQSLDGALAAL